MSDDLKKPKGKIFFQPPNLLKENLYTKSQFFNFDRQYKLCEKNSRYLKLPSY